MCMCTCVQANDTEIMGRKEGQFRNSNNLLPVITKNQQVLKL